MFDLTWGWWVVDPCTCTFYRDDRWWLLLLLLLLWWWLCFITSTQWCDVVSSYWHDTPYWNNTHIVVHSLPYHTPPTTFHFRCCMSNHYHYLLYSQLSSCDIRYMIYIIYFHPHSLVGVDMLLCCQTDPYPLPICQSKLPNPQRNLGTKLDGLIGKVLNVAVFVSGQICKEGWTKRKR